MRPHKPVEMRSKKPASEWRDPVTVLDHLAQALSTIRAALAAIAIVFVFLVPALPFFVVRKLNLRAADWVAFLFSKTVLWLLRVRVTWAGEPIASAPVMMASNHICWLDIFVLNSLTPMYFIAKKDVDSWPVVGPILRQTGVVYVNRESRAAVRDTVGLIAKRMGRGLPIVLFAEGTSTDGRRVLPFRSSLFGIDFATIGGEKSPPPSIQPCAIVYTRRNGLRLRHGERPGLAWIGDMTLLPHLWSTLIGGPLDVTVSLGKPVPVSAFDSRKDLSTNVENTVREMVGHHLYP